MQSEPCPGGACLFSPMKTCLLLTILILSLSSQIFPSSVSRTGSGYFINYRLLAYAQCNVGQTEPEPKLLRLVYLLNIKQSSLNMISDVQIGTGIEILQQHLWTEDGPEKCLSPHLSLLQIMNMTIYNNYLVV